MNSLSVSSDYKNESDHNTNASMIQISLKKKTQWLCNFNNGWKDTDYYSNREVHKNQMYCTLCRKELGRGDAGESMRKHVKLNLTGLG